jgi:hypothetical protein
MSIADVIERFSVASASRPLQVPLFRSRHDAVFDAIDVGLIAPQLAAGVGRTRPRLELAP